MIPFSGVALISLFYFGLLFAVAYYADQKRKAGKSLIANPTIYALSLAVYVTSWTFYGSVGRAATTGLDFLPVYLGPTLIAFAWWFLLRKMVRISKEQNLVSIADFISSRYGKSESLGAIVTLFAILGIMPYIALQLKAVSFSFDLLAAPPHLKGGAAIASFPQVDSAFVATLVLAAFGVLFGARSLDASERHEGLVAAIALESLVKIVAFVTVGIFVTYGLFDGFADIFQQFLTTFPERRDLLLLGTADIPYGKWFSLTVLSMMAFMFLPRQFHIMVVENSSEAHIKSAMWQFPAYMFLINLFVVPVALGGLLLNGGETANADYFLLHLPLQTGHPWLAILVFIGGFSASAGMVMVSSVTLSTMILNHLVMPVVLRLKIKATDISGLLINTKRLGIVGVLLLGYLFFDFFGESHALVNMGLISFVAATQFAPAMIGGIFWRRANLLGATAGLVLGFVIWFYTLLIPFSVQSGWLSTDILTFGPFGIGFLRPLELFGLSGFDIWSHALFWTLFFNVGAFLTFSLFTQAVPREQEQIPKFVDVFTQPKEPGRRERMSRAPTIVEFVDLMAKFIGDKQAHSAITEYLGEREIDERGSLSEYELPNLKRFTERTLAGSVGAAPARIIVENYLATRGSKMEDVFDIFGSVTISRKSSREQMSVLYEAARLVSQGGALQTILDDILDLLMRQFKFDLCVIRMLDERSMTLTVRSQKGMTSKHLGESERNLNRDTCIGEAFLDNKPTWANDTDFMVKPQSAQIIHREGIKSFLHVAIAVEGQPIGVLSAFSKTVKGIFSKEFIELFQGVASQIGVAWRNAQQTKAIIEAREQEKEMEIAKTIQIGLLPNRIPEIKNLALAGICVPARQVGGDYYDFLPRDQDALDLVIADVSGHNVGAALIMAETRTFIQARAKDLQSPSEIMCALNDFFYEDLSRAELFITMFYLKFHAESRRISFSSAGHTPPMIYSRQASACRRLDAEGLILGIHKGVVFEELQEQLEAGDLVLLYTDGIPEAENPQGEFFGDQRLCALLQEHHAKNPEDLITTILDQVRLFCGTETFQDDVSMVVMQIE